MKKADSTKRVQEKRKGFNKKIGNTTYDVSFHYSRPDSRTGSKLSVRRVIKRNGGRKKFDGNVIGIWV